MQPRGMLSSWEHLFIKISCVLVYCVQLCICFCTRSEHMVGTSKMHYQSSHARCAILYRGTRAPRHGHKRIEELRPMALQAVPGGDRSPYFSSLFSRQTRCIQNGGQSAEGRTSKGADDGVRVAVARTFRITSQK